MGTKWIVLKPFKTLATPARVLNMTSCHVDDLLCLAVKNQLILRRLRAWYRDLTYQTVEGYYYCISLLL